MLLSLPKSLTHETAVGNSMEPSPDLASGGFP